MLPVIASCTASVKDGEPGVRRQRWRKHLVSQPSHMKLEPTAISALDRFFISETRSHRFPWFTAFLLLTTTLFALGTDSASTQLDPSWRRWLGFSPLNLVDLAWQQTLTSLVVTAGEWNFLQSALMMTIAVGCCEFVYGTWTAIRLFFASHLIVVVGMSLLIILPAHFAGADWGTALATQHDVGPSAGYYGCLGVVLGSLNARWRNPTVVALLIILVGRLAISFSHLPNHASVVSADLSHLAALPLGLLAVRVRFVRPLAGSGILT